MQQQQRMGCGGDGGGGCGGGDSGGGGGGGGGVEPNRSLARFRSAPASWLDTLLQDDDPVPQNQCLPQLPNLRNSTNYGSNEADPTTTFFDTTSGAATSSAFGFLRQNSSPAELLGQLNSPSAVGSDGFFSNFELSGNYDYQLSLLDIPTNKRVRESIPEQEPAKFSSQLKGEQSRTASFSDMEMDKLFEDSVPFRVRAKRGCATHPRSIAERVRRTRISDRIRKLQELVPNMDKQTNTADMLEEAVEYVKFLQKQIQELTEHQRKCKCLSRD